MDIYTHYYFYITEVIDHNVLDVFPDNKYLKTHNHVNSLVAKGQCLTEEIINNFLTQILTEKINCHPCNLQFMLYKTFDLIYENMENGYDVLKKTIAFHRKAINEKGLNLLFLLQTIAGLESSEERLESILDDFSISLIHEIKLQYASTGSFGLHCIIPLRKDSPEGTLIDRTKFLLSRLQKEIDAGEVYNMDLLLPNAHGTVYWDSRIIVLQMYKDFLIRNNFSDSQFITRDNTEFFCNTCDNDVDDYISNDALKFFMHKYLSQVKTAGEIQKKYSWQFYYFCIDFISLNKNSYEHNIHNDAIICKEPIKE